MVAQLQSAESLKDAGNDAVKRGDWLEACDYYTEALQHTTDDDKALKAVIYRNRSLSRLKQDDFEGAENDCTKALEYNGSDIKALFRRALAREQLDNIGAAFKDAREALRLCPNDRSICELLQRLTAANNEKLIKATSVNNKLCDVFNELICFVYAFNNLLVLARESEAGASRIWDAGNIVPMLLSEAEDSNEMIEVSVAAVRILDELIKNHGRALLFLSMHNNDGIQSARRVCRIMCSRDSKDYVDAAGLLVQREFNALAKMDRGKDIKPDPEVAEANKLWIIRVILELQDMLTDKSVTTFVREMVIDILLKNLMHMDGGLPRGWSWKFVENQGLLSLLDVSSQIPEQCEYPVSHQTRQHVAICLQRLDEDMVFDNKRMIYKEKVDLFFNNLIARASNDEESVKVRIKLASFLITMLQVTFCISLNSLINRCSTLIKGPVDIGVNLVTNDQVTAIMLQMAASCDPLVQSVAAELIVMTVVKHERATSILKVSCIHRTYLTDIIGFYTVKVGFPILRKLYDSEDENVKVRALVGLCKCASAGGDDISRATMKEGASLKLAHTCKKFLLDYNKYSVDVRRFACEGLSYLSLDADVKEWITKDSLLLRALFCLAQSAGALCVFTLANIYVNLTNSFEKPQVDEEMVKLAQFAKHHVPEVHPKDTDDYVEKRVRCLVDEGAVAACVAISKTESHRALELLARKIKAAHALAKLGAKTNPEIAFPGQRAYEVVKPLCDLLHPDVEGKANYDALVTLTNLVIFHDFFFVFSVHGLQIDCIIIWVDIRIAIKASMSDSVRRRIIKERAVPKIEEFWFMTDHAHLRAAAAELLLNLLFLDEFFNDTVKKGTDKLKLWVLYSAEEDVRLARSANAAFAILTQDVDASRRIFEEIRSWPELLKEICMHNDAESQQRGLMAIANIMESDEKLCSEIVATEVFRVLVAVAKLGIGNKERKGAIEQARRGLAAAEKFGIIKPTDRELYERTKKISTISEE
ncbi:tetratricopeptide repeat protein [Dictyocaulus viviparus]|uniref:Tetratricopeptide repeat protein n=1 Tax=Dictyocaulus viviparus TaxID=29172 RepID=A0A0D8X8G9_DICVI|nr:tetratricopeptide repeat protein [Dictyocaulus viviparus]